MAAKPINKGEGANRTASDSLATTRPIRARESDLFIERLNEVIGDESISSFARRAGFRESVLRGYFSEGKRPGMDYLVAIANAGGVTVDWLATGRLPKTRAALSALPDEAHYAAPAAATALKAEEPRKEYGGSIGYVAIPLYSEVRAAAGYGAVNGRELADDALMFKEDWIRHELGARPQDLWLIRVHGDSMEPTLRAGDVILVDSRASRPDREGIYILRLGEALLVKRLQVMPGRKIRVTSDNAAFEPWMIDQDGGGDDTAIIGRVVWSGRRM